MVTVLIPTRDHQDTICHAIASVQAQTLRATEIFVVSDGAPPHTRSLVEGMAVKDARIRYFENPKGHGHGEVHRHAALQHASTQHIAYLGDDDLWLPNHLETLLPHLAQVDFVHSTQATIVNAQTWVIHPGDLESKVTRQRMLNERYNFFGPSCVAHTLASYHRLPQGWRARPDGIMSDLYMWRQWLRQEELRFRSLVDITMLHLGSPTRIDMSIEARCEEMAYWRRQMSRPDFRQKALTHQLEQWRKRLIAGVPIASLLSEVRTLRQAKNHGAAIRLAKIILNSLTDCHPARALMGHSLLAQGRVNSAITVAQDAIAAYPNEIRYHLLHGAGLRKSGRHAKADAAITKALELNPHHPGAHVQDGIAKRRRGQLEAAKAAFQTALRLNPDNLSAQRSLAKLNDEA